MFLGKGTFNEFKDVATLIYKYTNKVYLTHFLIAEIGCETTLIIRH